MTAAGSASDIRIWTAITTSLLTGNSGMAVDRRQNDAADVLSAVILRWIPDLKMLLRQQGSGSSVENYCAIDLLHIQHIREGRGDSI